MKVPSLKLRPSLQHSLLKTNARRCLGSSSLHQLALTKANALTLAFLCFADGCEDGGGRNAADGGHGAVLRRTAGRHEEVMG